MLKPVFPNHPIAIEFNTFKNILLAILGQNQLKQDQFVELYNMVHSLIYDVFTSPIPRLLPEVGAQNAILKFIVRYNLPENISNQQRKILDREANKFEKWLNTLIPLANKYK